MKKIIIIVIILAAVVVGFIPVLTSMMASKAFEEPDSASAQDTLLTAISWKMRLYQYTEARRIAEKAIIWFPESPNIDSFIYKAASCAERDGVDSAAIFWYRRFLQVFPSHPWNENVKARLEKLGAPVQDIKAQDPKAKPAPKASRQPVK